MIERANSDLVTLLLSLNIKKAFDGLSLDYLFYVLTKWGFCENFFRWICALYSGPLAYVNNRGTRQSCPLSFLLFVLAIERLEILVREPPEISGIKITDSQHKLCMFACDSILTLTNLFLSLPNFMGIMNNFTKISGLQINNTKSKILYIILVADVTHSSQNAFEFRWVTDRLPYLRIKGMNLPRSYNSLYQINYPALINLKELLGIWKNYSFIRYKIRYSM